MDLYRTRTYRGLQDLKDFARQPGLDVVYSEVGRDRDPAGAGRGFVNATAQASIWVQQ